MKLKLTLGVFTILTVLFTSVGNTQEVAYIIEDLGALPNHSDSYGYAVNDLEQVAGGSTDFFGYKGNHGYVWERCPGMRPLMPAVGFQQSWARGINQAGYVVGECANPGLSKNSEAARWDPDGNILLLGILPGGIFSSAHEINLAGTIVGISDSLAERRAFVWDEVLGMRSLGVLPNGYRSHALSINEWNQVVGDCNVLPLGVKAFIWDEVSGMQPLPEPPGTEVCTGMGH